MIREIMLHPEMTSPLGLKPCGPMRELERVVILTGANGAGKTRFLGLIRDLLASAPQPGVILVDGPAGLAPPTAQDVGIDLTLRPQSPGEQHRDPLRDAYQAAPGVVERAARALFNAEHARLARSPSVAEAARDAEQLNVLLAALLGKRIEPEVDEIDGVVHPRLGERRFDAAELSPGERMLLTWAVLLHRHGSQLRDAVLFLDEPELHLHPAATARLFSRLVRGEVLGERGQIWLATHSPAVLLAAQATRVLWVEDGAMRWSEAASPQVLGGLSEADPPLLRMTPPALPVGSSDFRKLRREDARYVDKTAFIADVLRNRAQVLLFTRPRRFGKTMNQSALRYFVEKTTEDRSDLFAGLTVWQDRAARRHFQRHPVIDLTLKDVKASTWQGCRTTMARKVADAYHEHRVVLEKGALSKQETERFLAVLDNRADPGELMAALRLLSALVANHHGEQVVILIDEYDTPIHSAYLNGYYDEAVEFFRNFLSEGLKDNPHLIKGVLTGVLRVAKESLFSGLNNVVSYSLLHTEFADCFGFTADEVARLLRESGESGRQEQLERWYNGYRFGNGTIYNPWSIANYLNQEDREPRPFWTDTADTELLRRLLIDRGIGLRGDLQVLLSGGAIHKTIAEDLVLRDIGEHPDAVWSLLLFAGYLTNLPHPSPVRSAH